MFIPLPIPDPLKDPENLPEDPDPDVIYLGRPLNPEERLANTIDRVLQSIRDYLSEE